MKKKTAMDIGLSSFLIIIIIELAALFIQNFQPENTTIIYAIMNSLIGYVISNFIFKNEKVQKKIKEKLTHKNPEIE